MILEVAPTDQDIKEPLEAEEPIVPKEPDLALLEEGFAPESH